MAKHHPDLIFCRKQAGVGACGVPAGPYPAGAYPTSRVRRRSRLNGAGSAGRPHVHGAAAPAPGSAQPPWGAGLRSGRVARIFL